MRSHRVRISSLNWSAGGWRKSDRGAAAAGPGEMAHVTSAGAERQASLWEPRVWPQTGRLRRLPGPYLFQVRESQGGDRGAWGVAPETDGQAAWWLRPTEPDSGVTWSLNGGRGRITSRQGSQKGCREGGGCAWHY